MRSSRWGQGGRGAWARGSVEAGLGGTVACRAAGVRCLLASVVGIQQHTVLPVSQACNTLLTTDPSSPSTLHPAQVAALLVLTRQPWYQRFDPHPQGTNCFDRTQANSAVCSQSYENTTIFLVSLGQFLIAAFVFNKGPPFRRPIYTNLWLLLGECQGPRGWWEGPQSAGQLRAGPAYLIQVECCESAHTGDAAAGSSPAPSCSPAPPLCSHELPDRPAGLPHPGALHSRHPRFRGCAPARACLPVLYLRCSTVPRCHGPTPWLTGRTCWTWSLQLANL